MCDSGRTPLRSPRGRVSFVFSQKPKRKMCEKYHRRNISQIDFSVLHTFAINVYSNWGCANVRTDCELTLIRFRFEPLRSHTWCICELMPVSLSLIHTRLLKNRPEHGKRFPRNLFSEPSIFLARSVLAVSKSCVVSHIAQINVTDGLRLVSDVACYTTVIAFSSILAKFS